MKIKNNNMTADPQYVNIPNGTIDTITSYKFGRTNPLILKYHDNELNVDSDFVVTINGVIVDANNEIGRFIIDYCKVINAIRDK